MSSRGAVGGVLGLVVLSAAGCSPPFEPPPFGGGTRPPPALDGGASRLPPPDWSAHPTAPQPPAPLTGGTLLIARDGHTAIATDPERDRVSLVDLTRREVLAQFTLRPGDVPFRIAEDAQRRAHITLRGGGAVLDIDLQTRTLLGRREVCLEPRGIAFDPDGAMLHVACADGELVSMAAAFGAPLRRLGFGPDLRDVVVDGPNLLVTRFRSAEVLTIEARSGQLAFSTVPPTLDATPVGGPAATYVPHVAWRAAPLPEGGAIMVHQRARATPIPPAPAYYGPQTTTRCNEAVANTTATVLHAGARPVAGPIVPTAVLPVDVAVSPDGARVALVAAGNWVQPTRAPQVYVYERAMFESAANPCAPPPQVSDQREPIGGQVTAVAFDAEGRVVVQTREPAALHVMGEAEIPLGGESRDDMGHALFHGNAGSFVACASCHPEGDDDGHIWRFSEGARRTQPIRGGVLQTAPLHWAGDLTSFTALMNQTFSGRMGGGRTSPDQITALSSFVNALPPAPVVPPTDIAAVERGRALFADPAVNCASCHSGDRFTNNQTVPVGTRFENSRVPNALQVPTLRGLFWRAPYMHDGCAATLRDRFTNPTCGGGDAHGHTSQLSSAQLDDLVAFLQTL